MIRANNPAIDVDALRARIGATAARLRESGIEERRDGATASDSDSTRALLLHYRNVSALLDRAEDFNYPLVRVPQRLAKLRFVADRPARFMLKLFNYVFRRQRNVSAAQTQAVRELAEVSATSTRRLLQLEREVERLRKIVEQQRSGSP